MTVTNKTTAYLVAILATIVVMCSCPVDCLACAATSAKITSVPMVESVSKSSSVVKAMTHSPAAFPAQTVSVSPSTSLDALQRRFVDLRFGMFIHFNMPTYVDEDWPDPDALPELFNPVKLDCRQWARAAKSAGMTYGCLTTKHHSGFCIWDTKTTDYSVMSSPFKRDVVKEYVDAFRAEIWT